MTGLYLPIGDIARLYRVSTSTARRWAGEDAWRRTVSRPVRYHAADAQASWDKRHTGRIMTHLATRYPPA